jgi:hypothetical protein
MDYYGLVVDSEGDTGSHMLSKLLLAAVIGCSVALCAAWIFTFKKNKTGNNRFYQRGLQAPTDIVTSFMVFYVAFSILPIFFGQRYAFHISFFRISRVVFMGPAIEYRSCGYPEAMSRRVGGRQLDRGGGRTTACGSARLYRAHSGFQLTALGDNKPCKWLGIGCLPAFHSGGSGAHEKGMA